MVQVTVPAASPTNNSMSKTLKNISVIGAGAWGTALAATARRAGCATRLYAREIEVAEAINAGLGNPVFLKDTPLPDGIKASATLSEAVKDADAAILVVPAQFMRATARDLADVLPAGVPVVLAAKGIEQGDIIWINPVQMVCLDYLKNREERFETNWVKIQLSEWRVTACHRPRHRR